MPLSGGSAFDSEGGISNTQSLTEEPFPLSPSDDPPEMELGPARALASLFSGRGEGQRLAYGVYIYHVDIPGVGEKIGRFALIK